jgi:predicted glutamine amidotransferase
MCRLFAAYAWGPIEADVPLVLASYSLLRLSHIDKKRKQADGWGIGWFSNHRPKIHKSPHPIYKEVALARRAARQAAQSVVLGHVRWASNPLKLKKSELIGQEHSQPFSHDDWLFVHNGTLYIPREVRAHLGRWARYIKGKNDSEVLFYWLLKTVVHGRGSLPARVRGSLRGLEAIWRKCRHSYPLYKYPYHGLNWVLSNGRTMLAFCYVDPRGQVKYPALGHRKQPYYALQMRQTPHQLMLASEPMDKQPGWKPVGHGHLVVATKRSDHIQVQNLKVA